MKLRTDVQYVTPDGRLTQAGVQAIQGQIDGITPAPPTALVVADFDPAAIVTSIETIAANDVDTALPTAAAVKDYVDASIPSVPISFETAWHPYNMTAPGDGSTGEIYSFATNGLQASVTATFADGYDYLIRLVGVSPSGGANLQVAGVTLTTGGSSADQWTGTIEILAPTLASLPKWAMVNLRRTAGSTGVSGFSTAAATPFLGAFVFSAYASSLASVAIGFSGGNIDAGAVYLYRRRNYMFG